MLDSPIRLFGKQIPLSDYDGEATVITQHEDLGGFSEKTELEDLEKGIVEREVTEDMHENEEAPLDEDDSAGLETENSLLALRSENGETGEAEQGDENLRETTLKKPDKILPCPRCEIIETKFCYYNNYNVNQPRYFCKACQRYWTSGGTVRNMAVGAGRRKNKNSPSSYRHITDRINAPLVKIDGEIPNFGFDAPICGSIASILSTGERVLKGNSNGLQNIEEQRFSGRCVGHEISDNCSSVSSVTEADSIEEGGRSHIPYFPGVPWPYCSPGFPLSFYHGSYLSYNAPGNWNTPNSPTLGKHSRDSKGSVLIPKTLRFDDPNDAAKSSIWAALGIKNESINSRGMFKDFESKCVERSSVLCANPAALNRSLNFHEIA